MIREIILGIVLVCLSTGATVALGAGGVVQKDALPICSLIITELSEGRVSLHQARQISLAIALAGNRHFGKVTCGDMWLYMALVHVESGFRNNIVNEYNCRGMFQIHAPSWARKFGLTHADLLDLHTNADCGVRVLKYYLDQYRGLVPALSAYNSDHPQAATGYAWAVLNTRKKIKKRYIELYRIFRASEQSITGEPVQVSYPQDPAQRPRPMPTEPSRKPL